MKPNETKKTDLLNTMLLGAREEEDVHANEVNVTALSRVLNALPYALELQAPPPALKQRILSALRDDEASDKSTSQDARKGEFASEPPVQLWKSWASTQAPADLLIQRKEVGAWEQTGVAGVEVKQLFVDQARNYVTMLVRMAPGASYPSHRHGGFEECYVLEGDLAVGDTVLFSGDYQRAEGGSVHGLQSTQNGCLLFIVSSQYDELLA